MIKLSIVIPAFNVEKYIEKCLQSCIDQDITSDNYELIVVDDGSSDNTYKIVENFRALHPQFQIKLFFKSNGGLSSARNFAMQHTKGKYTWFVDSDDYITKNCLKKLMFEVDKGLEILMFDHDLVNIEGKILLKPEIDVKIDEPSAVMTGSEFLSNFFKNSCMPCMFLFDTEFLKINKLNFPDGYYFEDMLFTPIAIHKANKIQYLNSIFYNYLIREDSIMRSSANVKKRILDSLYISSELKKYSVTIKDSSKYYFENLYTATSMYALRRSIKDFSDDFSEVVFLRAKNLGLIPVHKVGAIKRKILATVLNSSPFIYKIICKILP